MYSPRFNSWHILLDENYDKLEYCTEMSAPWQTSNILRSQLTILRPSNNFSIIFYELSIRNAQIYQLENAPTSDIVRGGN